MPLARGGLALTLTIGLAEQGPRGRLCAVPAAEVAPEFCYFATIAALSFYVSPQLSSQQQHPNNTTLFFRPGGGGGGGAAGGFLFDSADLLDAVSAIRSPNRSDFLPVEGDWGMVHVRERPNTMSIVTSSAVFRFVCRGVGTRVFCPGHIH